MTRKPAPSGIIEALYRAAGTALAAGRYDEGIAQLEKLLALAPPNSDIHNNLGTAHWKCGRLSQAEKHYAIAVRLSPGNAAALNNYGGLLMEQSRTDEAERPLQRAYALNPAHPSISNNMGQLYARRGDLPAAEKCFLAAVAARPGWSDAHANLANIYQQQARHAEAEAHYRQALSLDARNAAAWKNFGGLMFELGRHAEASEALRRSADLRPESESVWSSLLQQLELMNRTEAMTEVLAEARKRFPQSPVITAVWARLQRRNGDVAAAIGEMEKVLPVVDDSREDSAAFYFELGLLYDRAGKADEAFESFRRAKSIVAAVSPEGKNSDSRAWTAVAHRLEAQLTPELAKSVPSPVPEDRPSPVFLLGFPRSGTTLLDQILSSHPGVYVSEELPGIDAMGRYLAQKFSPPPPGAAPLENTRDIWRAPSYPSAIARLQPEDIAAMREAFWREHDAKGSAGDRLFVDKSPFGTLHAALLHAVFPRSKFILSLRHPCDCVLSCFMAPMYRYYDIGEAARSYDEVFRVWEQTRKVFPLEAHVVRYEDVVSDFRATVESLLSFLGLSWNDAVLEYDRTARAKERIRTPSYHQVTEKLYTRASGRWHRYREHMGPVLDILSPWAQRYGYSMEPQEASEQ